MVNKPTGLRRLQPRPWPRFFALLALVISLGAGGCAAAIFGLGGGDGADPLWERLPKVLLGEELEEALEQEAERREGEAREKSGEKDATLPGP